MSAPPPLTDRRALLRNRARANHERDLFLHDIATDEIKDRLAMVKKTFNAPVIVTGHGAFWQAVFPDAKVIDDAETLDLESGAHDLVIHAMALHWANDPVGQLIQCRRALKPDGLFLAVCFGGQTLHELRASLAQAEAEVSGGLSPRVAPMAEIRDLGGLVQRAGFALPVADSLPVATTYASPRHLAEDLAKSGEGNALQARPRHFARREVFRRADTLYRAAFSEGDGRIRATFDLVFLLGWAPHESQPQPLRPGSAAARLADALGTMEVPLKD